MSAVHKGRYWWLRCNARSCPSTFEAWGTTLSKARRMAESDGWRVDVDPLQGALPKDYCPTHNLAAASR